MAQETRFLGYVGLLTLHFHPVVNCAPFLSFCRNTRNKQIISPVIYDGPKIRAGNYQLPETMQNNVLCPLSHYLTNTNTNTLQHKATITYYFHNQLMCRIHSKFTEFYIPAFSLPSNPILSFDADWQNIVNMHSRYIWNDSGKSNKRNNN
jgi:hypothetical protein